MRDSVRDGVLLVPRAVDVLLVIMHRQVLQSCTDSVINVGVVPQLQFIDRVFLPRCEQRQVPTVFRCSHSWVVEDDKVVDVPVVTRLGCSMWLVEEFHMFSTCSRCSNGFFRTLFPRAPCSWQPLAPVRCDSPRRLLDKFLTFSTC